MSETKNTTTQIDNNANVKSVLAEAMRLNAELAKLVVERFMHVVEAMVSMVRSDGAPLPLRRLVARALAVQSRMRANAERAGSLPDNAKDLLPPIEPQTMEHFLAIQAAMTPDEAALARDVAGNLGASELRQWFDELDKLTVPQAVHKIRVLIAGNTEALAS